MKGPRLFADYNSEDSGKLHFFLICYGESRASQRKAAVSSPIGEIREQLSKKTSGQLSKGPFVVGVHD